MTRPESIPQASRRLDVSAVLARPQRRASARAPVRRRWGAPGTGSNGVGTLERPRQQEHSNGSKKPAVEYHRLHHVGLLCESLERSMDFYTNVLGMEVRKGRPHDKLPYRGEWLSIGDEMIHLMELPDPDPKEGRPQHGGRDRHFCISVASIGPLEERLKAAGVQYTASMSGRAALFFRDPDFNVLECAELGAKA